MSLSKLDSQCERCNYKNVCDNKKMVACMTEKIYMSPKPQQITDFVIANTSLEILMTQNGGILNDNKRKSFKCESLRY